MRRAAAPTCSRGCWRRRSSASSARRWSSTTAPAAPASSAPRRSRTRSPTATPSAWWTARSSPILACSRTSCPTTRARTSSRCRCCRARSWCCACTRRRRSRPRRIWSTYAKANPGKLTFASAGIGTGIHLAGEQFRQVAGIEIVIVPYRGGAPALADFLSGKVDFTFGAVPTIRPHILDGKARGLGVTRGRAPQLPDIPSMEEIGYASVDSASEMGLIVPAATPRADRGEAAADGRRGRQGRDVPAEPAGAGIPADRQHDGGIPRPCRPRDREMDKIIAAGDIKPD